MSDLLITTLDHLIDINRQLVDIADRKKNILIERRIDALTELVQEEDAWLKKLIQLENERGQLVGDPSLTFSEYIEQFQDESIKQKLQTQQASLYKLMVELQDKNSVNDSLLKDALYFTRHMMEQITKSKQQNFNYQSPLQKQSPSTSTRGFFDTKA